MISSEELSGGKLHAFHTCRDRAGHPAKRSAPATPGRGPQMPARQLVLLCAATFCAQLAAATPFAHAAPGWRTQLVQTEQPAGAPRELQPPRRRVARARAVYTPPPAPPASLAAPCAGADLIPAAD